MVKKAKKAKRVRRFYWMGFVPDEDQLNVDGEFYLGSDVSSCPYYLVDENGDTVDNEGYVYLKQFSGERPFGILLNDKIIVSAKETEEGATQSWPFRYSRKAAKEKGDHDG